MQISLWPLSSESSSKRTEAWLISAIYIATDKTQRLRLFVTTPETSLLGMEASCQAHWGSTDPKSLELHGIRVSDSTNHRTRRAEKPCGTD